MAGAGVPLVYAVTAYDPVQWLWIVETMILVGACVVVPLGSALTLRKTEWPRLHNALPFGAPLMSLSAALAAFLAGPIATGCAAMFFVSTLALAAWGALRLWTHRGRFREEVAVDLALLQLPVSGVWLVVYRADLTLVGFSGSIALLTVAHFLFAGFSAALITGLTGRALAPGTTVRKVWAVFAPVVCAGPALVGIGITASPLVEVISAVTLAIAVLGLGAAMLHVALRFRTTRVAAVLLAVSAAVLVVTMSLAALFAATEYVHAPALSWPQMARYHGVLNALGFALCGVVAYALLPVSPREDSA